MKTGNNKATATTSVMGRSPFAEKPLFDLMGWKAIAAHMAKSPRYCQAAARRVVNPMPVVKLGGNAAASSTALNRWMEAEAASLSPAPGLRLVAG